MSNCKHPNTPYLFWHQNSTWLDSTTILWFKGEFYSSYPESKPSQCTMTSRTMTAQWIISSWFPSCKFTKIKSFLANTLLSLVWSFALTFIRASRSLIYDPKESQDFLQGSHEDRQQPQDWFLNYQFKMRRGPSLSLILSWKNTEIWLCSNKRITQDFAWRSCQLLLNLPCYRQVCLKTMLVWDCRTIWAQGCKPREGWYQQEIGCFQKETRLTPDTNHPQSNKLGTTVAVVIIQPMDMVCCRNLAKSITGSN